MFNRMKSAGHLTTWAARLFIRAIDRRLRPLGLSSGQIPILLALAESDSLSQKAFVEQAAIAQPVIAATLRRMEGLGLVLRRRDPHDGRSTLFSLTTRGRSKLERLYAEIDAGNAAALAGLSPQEAGRLLATLRKVIANLSAIEQRQRRRRRP